MKKFGYVALVVSVLAGGVVLGLAGGASSTTAAATGSHALLAALDDAQLMERADNVLVGEVVSTEVVPLKDDPDLPAPLSAAGVEVVNSGMTHIKWRVRVREWLKGSGPAEIIVVQAHGGTGPNGRALVEIEDPAQELFGALTHEQVTAGNTFTFWVDKYDWFQRNYYVLARAKTPAQ